MAQVAVTRLLDRVVVDVDHVVEHAHRGGHGALELVVVDAAVLQVLGQVDRAQVAHGDLAVAGVQRDLGAQVGRVHHAHVLLRAAHVAGVLEGDPGMAGLEQHRQHLAPQVLGRHALEQLDLATVGLGFIGHVGFFEGLADLVVQVGAGGGREQRPVATFHHALHEQVGNPVRRVHVVGAAAVVAGVLAQLQELFDVQVPGLEVRAHRALALAALVHGHGRVVDHLQERHHALALAVGALDVGAQRTHVGPVVAQATGELGQQRVFLQRLIDAVEVVGHRGQVAAGQLRTTGAGIEQRGRARHEVEGRQHVVELDGTRLAVDLVQRQAHGHAHEEGLRQLDAGFVDVQEVAVVQRLQAQVVELQVALGLQGRAQAGQVELHQLLVQQLGLHALLDEGREVLGVLRGHVGLHGLEAQHFLADGVQQQAGGGAGVAGVLLDQRAGGQDGGLVHFFDGHAVVQVAAGFREDGLGADVGTQVGTGRLHQHLQARIVQRHAHAVLGDEQRMRGSGFGRRHLAGTLLRTALAVQHIGTRHFMVATAHQAQFHLVLHVLDVEGAATRARAQQRTHHVLGQAVHRLAHAGRGRALGAVHRQEGLHQRDGDLVGLEGHHRAVAAQDLVALVGGCGGAGGRRTGGGRRQHRGRRRGTGCGVHKALLLSWC